MPDYSKCIIYTIRTPTGLYVGSTCNYTNRKYKHKSAIHYDKAPSYNLKLYKNIRENNDEWDMKPYSMFPCQNKMEMNVEEERVRRELNADLNMVCCVFDKEKYYKTKAKYIQDNKEKIYKKNKQYYEDNKEKICEYQKQYGKKYYQDNKEKNKEKRAEYMKQYREKKKTESI